MLSDGIARWLDVALDVSTRVHESSLGICKLLACSLRAGYVFAASYKRYVRVIYRTGLIHISKQQVLTDGF